MIVKTIPEIDPNNLIKGQRIKVFSDAKNNLFANWDIIQFANNNDLWKEKGTDLRRGDDDLFWGWCFLPTDADIQRRQDAFDRIDKQMKEMPPTRSSVELLEEN